ncbi:MAG: type IV secretion system protein [Rickettsiales bacterium]
MTCPAPVRHPAPLEVWAAESKENWVSGDSMRSRGKHYCIVFLGLILAFLFLPGTAEAAGFVPWQFRIGDRVIDCTVYNVGGSFYTVRVVQCIQSYIRDVALYFLEYTSDFFLPVTFALITLVIILFGIKLVSQARELKAEALMLLIKIGLVLTFCYNFGGWGEAAFNTIEDTVGFISQALEISTPPAAGKGCNLVGFAALLSPNIAAWAKVDCLVGEIIGFGPGIAMSGAIFGLIGSTLFSGSIGIMVFFIGIFMLISLIMFVLRCVYIYFLAYITLAVMIIISPMVIPLVLLPQSVLQNFDVFKAWLGYVLNSFITPLVLFAFLSMAANIFDYFIVNESNPSSLANVLKGTYNVDGSPRAGGPQNPANYYELSARCFKLTSFTDTSFYQNIPDYLDKMTDGDPLSPIRSGQNDLATFLPECAGLDFGPEQQQRLWEIGFSLLQILFAGYLMLTMMKLVPDIAGNLAGGGQALTSAAANSMGIESTVSNNMRQSEGYISNMTGSNFSFRSLVGNRTPSP